MNPALSPRLRRLSVVALRSEIASFVTGKTKKQCVRRYKHLAMLIRQKQGGVAAVPVDRPTHFPFEFTVLYKPTPFAVDWNGLLLHFRLDSPYAESAPRCSLPNGELVAGLKAEVEREVNLAMSQTTATDSQPILRALAWLERDLLRLLMRPEWSESYLAELADGATARRFILIDSSIAAAGTDAAAESDTEQRGEAAAHDSSESDDEADVPVPRPPQWSADGSQGSLPTGRAWHEHVQSLAPKERELAQVERRFGANFSLIESGESTTEFVVQLLPTDPAYPQNGWPLSLKVRCLADYAREAPEVKLLNESAFPDGFVGLLESEWRSEAERCAGGVGCIRALLRLVDNRASLWLEAVRSARLSDARATLNGGVEPEAQHQGSSAHTHRLATKSATPAAPQLARAADTCDDSAIDHSLFLELEPVVRVPTATELHEFKNPPRPIEDAASSAQELPPYFDPVPKHVKSAGIALEVSDVTLANVGIAWCSTLELQCQCQSCGSIHDISFDVAEDRVDHVCAACSKAMQFGWHGAMVHAGELTIGWLYPLFQVETSAALCPLYPAFPTRAQTHSHFHVPA